MKALILAAGMGRRILGESRGRPKTLLEIGGKPLLAHSIENLLEEGLDEILVVTGYGEEEIVDFLSSNFEELNVEYIRNERYEETNNIYSLYLARRKLEGEDFTLLNSDVFFHPGILSNLLNSEKRGLILSVDTEVPLGEEEMKVLIRDDTVLDISKEIPPEEAQGEYIGIARVDSEVSNGLFDAVKKTILEKGFDVFYEEAFRELISRGEYPRVEETMGLPWIEIDTPEDLRIAREKIAPLLRV